MGYDLRITRAPLGEVDDEPKITADEWLSVVESDPELSLAGYNGDYFALWNGAATSPERWFDWLGGTVMTKNPDRPTVAKMIELAEKLDGRVVGDDGETYFADGRVQNHNGEFEDYDWRASGADT